MRRRLILIIIPVALLAGCGGGRAFTATTAAPASTSIAPTTAAATTTTAAATTAVASTTAATTTTRPAPTTTATTTTTGPEAGSAWSRVGGEDAGLGGPGDQHLLSVAAGVPGVAAIGGNTAGMAAVWLRDAGGIWTPMMGGLETEHMQDVIAYGDALLVVGYEVTENGEEPRLWQSFDGWTWLGLAGLVEGGPGDQVMYAVTEYARDGGAPGLVAVGDDWSGGDADGIVWTSPDGIRWDRFDPAALGGPGDQLLSGVVAGGPGLVAVGREMAEGMMRPLVYVSADGEQWTRIEDESVFADYQAVFGVAVGGPGLVAVGFDGSNGPFDAAVWVSEDGYEWVRLEQEAFGGPADQLMISIAGGEAGLVAVGWDAAYGGDRDAAVWTSPDGLTWSQVPHDETLFGGEGDQGMMAVAAFGEGFVAVGFDESGGDSDAAIWLSPASG